MEEDESTWPSFILLLLLPSSPSFFSSLLLFFLVRISSFLFFYTFLPVFHPFLFLFLAFSFFFSFIFSRDLAHSIFFFFLLRFLNDMKSNLNQSDIEIIFLFFFLSFHFIFSAGVLSILCINFVHPVSSFLWNPPVESSHIRIPFGEIFNCVLP